MAYTNAQLDEKISKIKVLIEAYEDAILALASGEQSYTLDTGQTRQTVMRAQLGSLQSTLDRLENRLAVLCTRRHGSGVLIGRPGF